MKSNKEYIYYLDSGVTLVELLIVLCCICILAGVAMPNVKSLGNSIIIQIEAIQIAQDIRYTQQLSLNRRENYMLQLNKEKNFYYIKPANKPTEKVIKRVQLNRQVMFYYCTFKSRGSHYYIEFNSRTGIPGQTGRIELVDNHGNMRKIVVEPTTGRVRIE